MLPRSVGGRENHHLSWIADGRAGVRGSQRGSSEGPKRGAAAALYQQTTPRRRSSPVLPPAMDAPPLSRGKEESSLELERGGEGGRPEEPAGEQRRVEERSCGDGDLQLESRAVGFLRRSFAEDRRDQLATEGSNGRAAWMGRCTEGDRKRRREREDASGPSRPWGAETPSPL